MTTMSVSHSSASSQTVEGIARVVRVDGDSVWLEPEQTTSCGSCASKAACGSGAPGIGTVASRNAQRQFRIDNDWHLLAGDRVVVGIGEQALIKAALTAYAIPLTCALLGGGMAEATYGSDLITMAAMAAALGIGVALARLSATRLGARGSLAPRILRRALPGETCTES